MKNLKKGDHVMVPFTISCGECFFCQKGLFSCCDVSNPNAEIARKAMGQSPAGLFGYIWRTGHSHRSHMMAKALKVEIPFYDKEFEEICRKSCLPAMKQLLWE